MHVSLLLDTSATKALLLLWRLSMEWRSWSVVCVYLVVVLSHLDKDILNRKAYKHRITTVLNITIARLSISLLMVAEDNFRLVVLASFGLEERTEATLITAASTGARVCVCLCLCF